LVVNLGTVLLAAAVVNLFESTIAAVAMLAVFLPVVAGSGGIAGTQTVTLVVRGLAHGEVPHHAGFRLLARELLLGLLHGLALALLAGMLGWVWKGSVGLGLAIGIAMVGNLLAPALAGAGVPRLLQRLGIDPAVSSALFVTTFTDVFEFLIFLAARGFLVRALG
jgi:magnesium transporter